LNLYGMDLTSRGLPATVMPQRPSCHPHRLQPAASKAQPPVSSRTNAVQIAIPPWTAAGGGGAPIPEK
jgi:hypothetical protein